VSEGVRSVWILADSSHKIFELAKRRVYQAVRTDGVKVSTDNKGTPTKKRKVAHNTTKKGKETGSGSWPLHLQVFLKNFSVTSTFFLQKMKTPL
jgi:ribosomal protein L19E